MNGKLCSLKLSQNTDHRHCKIQIPNGPQSWLKVQALAWPSENHLSEHDPRRHEFQGMESGKV